MIQCQQERYVLYHFLREYTKNQALCDIEVDDSQYPDDAAVVAQPEPVEPVESQPQPTEANTVEVVEDKPPSKHASLATPAVRGLLKDLKVNILDVTGTGKDGRVTKDDVHKFAATRDQQTTTTTVPARPATTIDTQQSETREPLTHMQSQMFKTMTKSLQIPHFLFTDELKIDAVTALRRKLSSDTQKVTSLSFIVKAVSLALEEYPILNAKIDTTDPKKPTIVMRSNHNIGVAMDTPQGLIVPNIKNVAARSIADIAAEITRLSALGKEGKLTASDLTGGTFTVSNIGNIGGTYVSPVIVSTEVAILGVGRSRVLPVFDEAGQVARAELVNFSWSADHRVVDGATMARMANRVKDFMEAPDTMLLRLR